MVQLSGHGQVSDHVIKAMGFQPNDEGIELTASFYCLHVFEFHGINQPEGGFASIDGQIADVEYAAAIGMSVNELCNALLNDDYAEDEPTWQDEKKCGPPYLMVRFGPTSTHSAIPGHLMMLNNDHHTYDTFALAKSELQVFEDKALPSVLTASVVAVSADDRPHIRIRNVDRAVCGKTPDGKTLFDIRFSMSATLSVSRAITNDMLVRSLDSAKAIAAEVDPKVAKFFRLALGEDDPLKRFLYFFLSIEVQTHRTFGKINHHEHVANLSFPTDRIQLTSASFFGDSVRSWTNLRDRFLWCAHCVWTDLTQPDVLEFARLKLIRDGIAHGDITSPSGGDVFAVERLAIRLQQQG
jgi:hypothetical protein